MRAASGGSAAAGGRGSVISSANDHEALALAAQVRAPRRG